MMLDAWCVIGVTRDGIEDACGKPAVGYLRPATWEVEEFGPADPYPACRYHLFMLGGNGRAVELAERAVVPRRRS